MSNDYLCTISPEVYDYFYSEEQMGVEDLRFYVEKVKKLKPKSVLELGSGTGRVLLEVAKLGVQIDGVELSADCVRRSQQKLQKEGIKTSRIFNQDMNATLPGDGYSMLICPFRGLQHLYSWQDKLKLFKSVYERLEVGGYFVFDVFFPNFQLIDSGLGEVLKISEFKVSKLERIERWFLKEKVDHQNQYFEGTWEYRFFKDDKQAKTLKEKFRMNYFLYSELRYLSELCSFSVVEEFGSFSEEAICSDSENIVMVLKK